MQGIDLIHVEHHLNNQYIQGTDLILGGPHPTTQSMQDTDLIHGEHHVTTQYMQGTGLILDQP